MDPVPEFQAELCAAAGNKLGECPLWDDARQLICWIDIQGKRLLQHDPLGPPGNSRSFDLPKRPGSFCLTEAGDYLLALEDGFCFFDPSTGELRPILPDQDWRVPPSTRLNDGRVDCGGRFVAAGCVEKGEEPRAQVYRLNSDLSVETLLDNVRCGNSICFSEERGMFFADPALRVEDAGTASSIWQFPDYATTGRCACPQLFVDAENRPDGSVLDAEGCLWNAEFGAGRVVRYRPDGSVSMVVRVPVRFTTCAAFGGKDMQTMYITDASVPTLDDQRASS
ncbi:unnamed protein product [Effrenium voratum]|uniref:SMP-30/Gluconolactonase/LRE-like region domain-containing protein n=1 Tax=Effrenium voratum TaxID=2562239 RepID=A0AA36IUD4_9DINO|nr:unnamed protein product [Effrenium voratum]CAJ1452713.1 unnamed protein product [Effrenium voratum]